MKVSDLVKYYSKKDIKKAILKHAKNREVVPKFVDGGFGSRPSILSYEQEIVDLVRKGVSSFHMSEERWLQPMLLKVDMKKQELNDIRIGWDCTIDIDCPYVEYSKICALLLQQALEFHDIENYGIKFSGGSGFHLIIPFESFPKEINGKSVSRMFPDAAKIIVDYLKSMIKDYLRESLLEKSSIKEIMANIGKKDIIVNGELDPFKVADIDSQLASSRHLFRMPYSLNEKTWLVSIPLEHKEVADFKLEQAKIENVKVKTAFIPENIKPNEARELFLQAFDQSSRMTKEEPQRTEKKFTASTRKIEKEFFPPCIKNMLNGLEDGRKRSLFILINFLKLMNWDWDDVVNGINEWNQKNSEPLRESLVKGQLSYYRRRKGYMIPNCSNINFYKDINVCNKDGTCSKIKNPVNFPFKKHWKGIRRQKK